MQATVNPGEAKQIEQDYAHTTLASSEMAVATAQSTTEAIQAFIQMLRERVQAARQQEKQADKAADAATDREVEAFELPVAPPEPIEIKMGREIVYREGYENKAPINKLNPNKLKLLQAAVDTPQQADSEATKDLKGTINIKAGDELVYRMSKGAVETNRLQSHPVEPSLNVQAASVEQSNETSTPVTLASSTLESDQQAFTSAPSADVQTRTPEIDVLPAPPLAVNSDQPVSRNVVSILDVLERQNNDVADRATRKWMQQTTKVMQRSSQHLADRVMAIAANLRSRQVATTAIHLLQKYGTSDRPGRGSYQSEKYTLSFKGRMVTIADREGTDLMMFRKARWGPSIVKNDMVPSQEADFMRARQQIQIQGLEGISSEPPMRVRQLGHLSPVGDIGLTRDLTALALAKTARKLLDVTGSRPNIQGKRVFQGGSQYRIEETPNSLKVLAGERGQILSIDNGKIRSDLGGRDIAYFRFIDRELGRDLQLSQPATVTPLHGRQRERTAGIAIGE